MGFISCNAESAIATCDSENWPTLKPTRTGERIRMFTRDELAAATGNFSGESFLGKGSHGSVYKAILDGGRLTAAVKLARPPSADNEVEVLSRVRHPNIVNLVGFCPGRDIIVVDYMPNGSLQEALHTSTHKNNIIPPSWSRRVRYGLHVARAVEALHSADPPVIHRDIKSSNVLIDATGRARLGDFGLALRGQPEDVKAQCTPPAGTLGYLDPAYLVPADLSSKSDVFSFGVLLLELLSGRNAIDVSYSPPSVLDWAAPLIRRRDFAGICDPRIAPPQDLSLVAALALLAARCVRSSADKRPGMAEVVRCLAAVRARKQPAWQDLRRRVSCADDGYAVERSSTVAVRMKLVISLEDKESCSTSSSSDIEKPLVSTSDNTTH